MMLVSASIGCHFSFGDGGLISVQEMEKQQAKGELGEEQLRALEMDVTGKVHTHVGQIPMSCLTNWGSVTFSVT